MNNNENKNPQDWKKYWDFSNISKFVNNWVDSFYKYKDEFGKVMHLPDNINEINTLDLDLSTYEGYTEYMKRLGDIRNTVKDYDEFVERIAGKTATEIIDDIANKATTYYLENKDKKTKNDESSPVCVTCDKNKDVFVSNKDIKTDSSINRAVNDKSVEPKNEKQQQKSLDYPSMPSENLSETEKTRLKRIVNRYFDESLLPWYENGNIELDEMEYDWLHNEIFEFVCWLKKN